MIRIKRVNENFGGEVCKVLNYQETQDIYDKAPKDDNGKEVFDLDFTDEENKIIDEQYKKIISWLNKTGEGYLLDIVSKEGECYEIDPSYEVAYKVTSKCYFNELDIVAVKLPDDYYFVHVFSSILDPNNSDGRMEKRITRKDFNLLCDDIDGLEEIAQTIIKEINKEYGR